MPRISVQEQKPERSAVQHRGSYRAYKSDLRSDFNRRCGYCDDQDFYDGGSRGYHIDHFLPKSQFPHLTTTYGNLVYACPYCNTAKSDKWRSKGGFIDPCDAAYDEHLERRNSGTITHCSARGKYMHREIKLGLRRHQILWLMRKLDAQKKRLQKKLEGKTGENEVRILRVFVDIQRRIDAYFEDFKTNCQ